MDKIKNLLPLGYLYLIILGILKESILYNQLGINILKYSSIMDILISPISDIATTPILMIIIAIVIILSIVAQNNCTKEAYKQRTMKILGISDVDSAASNDEIKSKVQEQLVKILALGLLTFFVGIGFGAGSAKAKKIANEDIKYNNALSLISGEEHSIYLIGSNTSYYFYVRENDKNIYISPVTSVKTLTIKEK